MDLATSTSMLRSLPTPSSMSSPNPSLDFGFSSPMMLCPGKLACFLVYTTMADNLPAPPPLKASGLTAWPRMAQSALVMMTRVRRHTANLAPQHHDPLHMILHGVSYNRMKLVQKGGDDIDTLTMEAGA